MATGGGINVRHIEHICQLLESSETEKDVRDIILEDLSSTKEIWLIHLLVDYYFQTQSTNVQEILSELHESQAKALMDKLQDGVKTSETRLPALQLVLYLVFKELPWCHKLVGTPLFSSILKCLKTELDVPILMTALMVVVILLPSVPVGMGPHLSSLFEIFGRLSIFSLKKPANTPEVFILHLQVALYSLFQRLYGMYPGSFISFISKFYNHKENIHVYEEVLMPMLERVRLHPKLIMGRKETETDTSRWKNQETQDIVVSCSKLSLDLIEGSWEDSHCPVFQSIQTVDKYRSLNLGVLSSDKGRVRSEAQNIPQASRAIEDATSISSLYISSLDASAVGESPSVLIGLSTPPSSQRTTPAASFLDPTSVPGLPTDTPDTTPRQHTPSHADEGEKTTLSRSSSRGTFPQSKTTDSKRPCVVAPKVITTVPQTTPVTPGSHGLTSPTPCSPVGPGDASPFKSKASAFGAPVHSRSPAMRTLQFTSSVEEKDEEGRSVAAANLKELASANEETLTSSMEGASRLYPADTKSPSLPVESLPQVIGDLSTPDTDKLDLEVEEINEKEDKFDEDHSPTSSISTLASQTNVTAESVRQFMKKVNRIRFNSLTSSSSSDVEAPSVHKSSQRPRSCPPLKRLGLHGLSVTDGRPHGKSKKQASAGERMVSIRGLSRHKSMVDGKADVESLQREDSSDDLASYGSFKDTPQKTKTSSSTQPDGDSFAEIIPPPPASVNPVFQYILAPSKLAVCNNCHQQVVITSSQDQAAGTTITTFRGSEVPLFNMMSPPELLDRHLRLGSDIHAKELTKIPLTSKESTNWTHFGGVPPVDEVNILRGQILLMQNQLMYERHKRCNHAKRNRRLLRRITHVTTLEEQQKTLMAQVRIHEEEIQQLSVSLKLLQEDNRSLRQSQESDEYEKLVEFRTSLKENKDLKAAHTVLKNLLLNQREEYDKQQKKLESVQHQNLENEKELEICKERLANTEKLKQRVFELQKEVLLMQEFHQKCQEKLQQSRAFPGHRAEESCLISSLKAEINNLTKDNQKKNNLLEAYQTRVIELEQALRNQEMAMNETKRNLEAAKSCHDEQLKAVEERCQSMVHINQHLEAKVMELTCQLDQRAHKKMFEAKRAAADGSSHSKTSTTTAITSGNAEHDQASINSSVSASALQDSSNQSSSSKTVKKMDSHDVTDDAGVTKSHPLPVSVVVAKDEVSVASSTFPESSEVAMPASQLQTRQSRNAANVEILSDSGAASRTSSRVDSDVSMRSTSEHSLTTGDSGCWAKE